MHVYLITYMVRNNATKNTFIKQTNGVIVFRPKL